jgi:hypothetical protein
MMFEKTWGKVFIILLIFMFITFAIGSVYNGVILTKYLRAQDTRSEEVVLYGFTVDGIPIYAAPDGEQYELPQLGTEEVVKLEFARDGDLMRIWVPQDYRP